MPTNSFTLNSYAKVPQGQLESILKIIQPFLDQGEIINQRLDALVGDLKNHDHFNALDVDSLFSVPVSLHYARSSIHNFKASLHSSNNLKIATHIFEYLINQNKSHPNNVENVMVICRINEDYPNPENLEAILLQYYGLIKLKAELKAVIKAHSLPETYIRNKHTTVVYTDPVEALCAVYAITNMLMIENWLNYKSVEFLNNNFKTSAEIMSLAKCNCFELKFNGDFKIDSIHQVKVSRNDLGQFILELPPKVATVLHALTDSNAATIKQVVH